MIINKTRRINTIYLSGLPSRCISVYLYLADHLDKEYKCWPAIKTIARSLSLSYRTVSMSLQQLKKAGWIQIEKRNRPSGANTTNIYRLFKEDNSRQGTRL